MTLRKNVALYRHYDADGALLYVGASQSPFMRLTQHSSTSPWRFMVAKIEIEWFEAKEEALKAEVEAIRSELPMFNCQHGQRKKGAAPRRFGSHDNSEILCKIRDHIAETGETETAFGLRASNDYGLVARLKKGSEPRASTVSKILAALDGAA